MLRRWLIAFAAVFSFHATAVLAADEFLFPEPGACEAQPDDASIKPDEKGRWTDCEKWAWSCIRQGLEANLFTKQCLRPRSEASKLREKLRLAPFKAPHRYADTNAIGADFLLVILADPHYLAKIPPMGVRLFGAYFKDPINLENLTTSANLVLDGSNMLAGIRLTNFKTEKNLALDNSNIRGSVRLMRARIDGSLFLEDGVYDQVDLNDSRIGASVETAGSVFNDEFRFHRAEIAGKVIMTKARLTKLSAWNAHVRSSIQLRMADIRFGVDLTGSVIEGDVLMQDVTFGRRVSQESASCDWDPTVSVQFVLNELKKTLSDEDFAAAWRELVVERPMYGAVPQGNVCEEAARRNTKDLDVLSERNSVLLRDLRIQGALCLVDVTGEIALQDARGATKEIGKIAFDGTVSNSTVLSWKKSDSMTLWYMANYKTNYLLANLENRPKHHYTDNIDVGALTMMKRQTFTADDGQSDEYRVREKCDVTPGKRNTDNPDNPKVQQRIIDFFREDNAESPQPFANIVSRVESMGINATNLKIALSEQKYRNTCRSSQLTALMADRGWRAWYDQLLKAPGAEIYKFALDGICSAALVGAKYSVAYGHRPLNLILWALFFVFLLYCTLWLDKPDPEHPSQSRHPGLAYAFDNLVPLRAYRIDPDAAERRPRRSLLRFHVRLQRGLGFLLALLAFIFLYKGLVY